MAHAQSAMDQGGQRRVHKARYPRAASCKHQQARPAGIRKAMFHDLCKNPSAARARCIKAYPVEPHVG